MLFLMQSNVLFRLFLLLTVQAGSISADIRLILENCYKERDFVYPNAMQFWHLQASLPGNKT